MKTQSGEMIAARVTPVDYTIPLLKLPPVLRNITWLDFDVQKDCSIASRALSDEIMIGSTYNPSSRYSLFDFAKTCSPVSLTNISYEQVLDWNAYHQFYSNITVLNLTDSVNEHCHLEFCQRLGWEGDPDLSGPGVMGAYIIQVVLTSSFTVFYLCVEIAKWRSRRLHQKELLVDQLPSFILSAIPHVNRCFDVSWFSSLYFSLAISYATCALPLLMDLNDNKAVPGYLISFSFLGTAFSWAVTMSLFPWLTGGGTRAPPGRMLLFIFSIMASTLALTYPLVVYSRWWQVSSLPTYQPFETFCLASLEAYKGFTLFFYFTISCIFAHYAALTVEFTIIRTLVKPDPTGAYRRTVVPLARKAFPLCSFTIMWASLAFFARLRSEAKGLSSSNKDGDNQWGFGQIVAVLGWLPMAVEILSVSYEILARKIQAWRKKDERPHVEGVNYTAVTANSLRGSAEMKSGQREFEAKRVKTW